MRIALNVQEYQFALACRDFCLSHDPSLANEMVIDSNEIVVPDTAASRKAFLDHGLARLLYVFHLAIENKAVPPEMAAGVISDLANFNEKILAAFASEPAGDRLH
jgi:hypothetical protein